MTAVQILDWKHDVRILLNQEVTVSNLPEIASEVKNQNSMISGQCKKTGDELIPFHESRLGMPNQTKK